MPKASPRKRIVVVCGAVALLVASGHPAALGEEPGQAQGVFVPVAGGGGIPFRLGEDAYPREGDNALEVRLPTEMEIDVADSGEIYAAEPESGRVQRITSEGGVELAAEVPAVDPDSSLFAFTSFAVGGDGEFYLGSRDVVRQRDAEGEMADFAGPGTGGLEPGADDVGDGGPATEATLGDVTDLAVGPDGAVYIAHEEDNRVRRVDPDGTITTIAGGGDEPVDSAVGGPATDADLGTFDGPEHMAVDGSGSVYFTGHPGAPRVYRVDADGVLEVVAGNGSAGRSGDGGPATEAELGGPLSGLAVDEDGVLYIADAGNAHIRAVEPDGTISTLPLRIPDLQDIAVGPDGELYIARALEILRYEPGSGPAAAPSDTAEPGADPWSDRDPGEVATAVDGGAAQEGNGLLESAMAVGRDGYVYQPMPPFIGAATRIDPDSGNVDTIRVALGRQFDALLNADVATARAIAADGSGGIYLADAHQVYRVTDDGGTSVIAGGGPEGRTFEDGMDATAADLLPGGIALDGNGSLYLVNHAEDAQGVYRVDPDGTISMVTEELVPYDIAADGDGTVYAVSAPDADHPSVSAIRDDGTVEELTAPEDAPAEEVVSVSSIEGRAEARDVELYLPSGIAAAPDGAVYVATSNNIQRITPDGAMVPMLDTDPEERRRVMPGELTLDPHGNLYFLDRDSREIRVIARPGEVPTPLSATAVAAWSVAAAAAAAAGLAAAVVYWRRPLGAAVRRVRGRNARPAAESSSEHLIGGSRDQE